MLAGLPGLVHLHRRPQGDAPAGRAAARARSVKVLDRFAIDYALCMYCGICVEVCPFDALFWSPEFEYAEYDILQLTHEKDRLEEWTYKVLPPPELEEGAEVLEEPPPRRRPAVHRSRPPRRGRPPRRQAHPPRRQPRRPAAPTGRRGPCPAPPTRRLRPPRSPGGARRAPSTSSPTRRRTTASWPRSGEGD